MTAAQVIAALAGVPLFGGMPEAQLEEFASSSHERKYQKGEMIYLQGERPSGLLHVLTGQIKVSVTSEEGDEKVIEIYSEGNSFGLAELFGQVPCCSFAQAVAPTALLIVGKHAIASAINRIPGLAGRLLSELADRMSALQQDIATYCFHSANRRTLDFLIQQAEPGDIPTVELSIRKQLIAARLGLTPESFSRSLRELANAGLITVTGRRVTLDDRAFGTRGQSALPPSIARRSRPKHAGRSARMRAAMGGRSG